MYEVSYISAKSTDKVWSGVYGYRPDSSADLDARGEMLVAMSIGSDQKFEFEKLAQLLLDELQQSYFLSGSFTGVLSQLETSVELMVKRMDQILMREQQLRDEGIDMELAISIIKEDVVYLGAVGDVQILLNHDDKLIEVGSHLKDPTGRNFFRYGSVQLSPDKDVVLIGTKAQMVSKPKWQEIADVLDITKLDYIDNPGFAAAIVVSESRLQQVMSESAKMSDTADASAVEVKEDANGAIDKKQDSDASEEQGQPADKAIVDDEKKTDSKTQDKKQDSSTNTKEKSENSVKSLQSESKQDAETSETKQSDIEEDLGFDAEPEIAKPETKDKKPQQTTARPEKSVDKSDAPTMSTRLKTFAGQAKQASGQAADRAKGGLQNLRERVAKFSESEDGEPKTYQVLFAKLVNSIKSFLAVIVRNFRKYILGDRGGRAQYLRGRKPERNWRMIGLVSVILFIVVAVVGFNIHDGNIQSGLRTEATTQIREWEDNYLSIEADVESQLIGIGNEQERMSKIEEVDDMVAEIRDIPIDEIRENDDLAERIDSLERQYTGLEDMLRGVTPVEPELIADLGVNFQNVEAADMVLHDGNLYVTDDNNNVIYEMNAESGATPSVLVEDDLTAPRAAAVDSQGDLIVIDADPDRSIGTVSLTDGSIVKHVGGLNVANVGTPSNVEPFQVGEQDRLYWIDNRSEEIKWVTKSPVGGYGSAPSIRREDPDFATANDIAIDGRIYVLSPQKGVLRYFANAGSGFALVPDTYTLTGLLPDDDMKDLDAFELTKDLIYVADSDQQRILVLAKARNGTDASFMDILAQLKYTGSEDIMTDIKEIVFDIETNQLYILDGIKVYRIKAYAG